MGPHAWKDSFSSKKALRCIFRLNYFAHTNTLFKKNKLIKFKDIYKRAMLKLYYKYKKNTLPNYFDRMFEQEAPNHDYNTRRNFTRFQTSQKSYTGKCIRFFIPELIQTTPWCILEKCDSHSIESFSRYIKVYYSSNYNDNCVVPDCYVCKNS